MQAIAAIAEKGAGLAFVSGGGLHEAAAHDDAERTLAITLLRGFHRPFATDGQPGGQILGQHTFTYALAPISGPDDLPRLLALRDQLATGVHVRQTDDGYGLGDEVEHKNSLLRIKPDVVRLSAFKPAADGAATDGGGLILRLYNPTSEDATAKVRLGFEVAAVVNVNLNEEDGAPLAAEGHKFEVAVPAKKIVSLRVVPA